MVDSPYQGNRNPGPKHDTVPAVRVKGGHFAAWEQPKMLSEEIRTGLRSLRT